MNTVQETRLSSILGSRPDLLTPEQRELALNQHACRTANSRAVACKIAGGVHTQISDLCADCQLIRAEH